MNQDDQSILFMPIISASLTNAVYTCQLLKPEMKDDPDGALQNVLVTYQRIIELMTKQNVQNADATQKLGVFVQSLISQSHKKLQGFSALPVLTAQKQQQKYMLDGQIILLAKIAEFLKKTVA